MSLFLDQKGYVVALSSCGFRSGRGDLRCLAALSKKNTLLFLRVRLSSAGYEKLTSCSPVGGRDFRTVHLDPFTK